MLVLLCGCGVVMLVIFVDRSLCWYYLYECVIGADSLRNYLCSFQLYSSLCFSPAIIFKFEYMSVAICPLIKLRIFIC